ncbi:MAG: hypothetical protein M1837_007088 [Sclerophora amabilis]|nr:MAG: hypothetical protein M1837_007088 [Sclerophora amabilis]
MAPYYPVYVSRSDGKLEIVTKKKKELNQPTDDQLDSKPDSKGVSDYYKKLDDDEPKATDWRRKLGGMLMREVGDKEHAGRNYILATFPENFCLYEHLKYTVLDSTGKLQKSARNHAKGPNDRQDAYLYGHPMGRKKRYRSPADFFPHLLWLATDEKGDPGNCSCKLCSLEEFQGAELSQPEVGSVGKGAPTKREEQTQRPPSISAPPISKAPAPVPAVTNIKKSIPQEPTKQPAKPSASPAPVLKTPPAVTPPTLLPTPIAPTRSREQEVDSTYNQFVFRPGELVWFNRGSAWGLSVILKREHYQNQQQQRKPRYLVQPLSNPYGHPEAQVISDEALLRPWLAWSAPGPTHRLLTGGSLTYDTIDWAAVVQGQLGPGDAEVDGSIFAAKSIDESYTLLHQIDTPNAAAIETYWNGMYLGAERIWVGEPIRLRIGTGNEIMVLHDIIEKTRGGFANSAPTSTVYLIGDIYTFATMPHKQTTLPPENPHLPQRLRMDLKFRNSASVPARSTASYWKLMQPLARLNLPDIKGRWYESSLLLPILRGSADFTRDLNRGDINDTGVWMNGRCDSSSTGNKLGFKRQSRREAFGRAVPPHTQLSRGLDGPPEENRFPVEPGTVMSPIVLEEEVHPPPPVATAIQGGDGSSGADATAAAAGHGGPLNHGVEGDGDIDQFMDLEGIDQDGLMNQFGDGGGQFYGDVMRQ